MASNPIEEPKSSADPTPQSQGQDGMQTSADGSREIRKRNRQWLSCDPCHRMKVKCDRGQPCSRCARGDRADKCIYEAAKKPAPASKKGKTARLSKQTPSDDDNPSQTFGRPEKMVKYRKGKVRHGGRTHWGLIAYEFREIMEFISGNATSGFEKRLKEVKKFFPPKRLFNYPFSPSREARLSTREGIISTLPEREVVQSLVDVYFETFEKTHSLFHEPTFKGALSAFWDDPNHASSGWIASLFLMLALSYFATRRYTTDSSMPAPSAKVEEYLESAQAALHLAPFMLKPTLENLQALCVVAIGKAFDVITLDDSDTLYIFTGFILRYAFTLGMHRDPRYAKGMPDAEAQERRKIWTTILFLDLRISIESGMPLLIRSADYDTMPPQDTFGALVFPNKTPPSNDFTPSSYQHRLAQCNRVVSDIVSVINSPTPDLEYEQVLEYDKKLRDILHEFPALNVSWDTNNSAHIFQRCALSIFIHRVLLALHQPYATDPHAWRDYQTSHFSVLQCSLAMLGLQRLIHESKDSPVPVGWLHELYRHDFMVAALYVCVALRRDQFSDASGGVTKEQARQTAWDTLLGSKEIWQKDATLSVHHYKLWLGVSLITAALKAIENGSPSTLDAMKEAAYKAVEEITERLGASTRSSSVSSNDNTQGGVLDFMFFDGMSMDPTFFAQSFDSMLPDISASWAPSGLSFEYMAPMNDPTKRPWPPTLWE